MVEIVGFRKLGVLRVDGLAVGVDIVDGKLIGGDSDYRP